MAANILCRYTDGASTLCYSTSGLTDIKVNGVSIGLTTTYNVNSTDEVEFIVPEGYDNYLFRQCKQLKSVTFSVGWVGIPSSMCYQCTALEEVILPQTLYSIGGSAFSGCSNLTNINLEGLNGLAYLSSSAFSNCTNLTRVKLPDGVTFIGEKCFQGCTALEEVYLGPLISSISDFTFRSCTSLNKITIENTVAPTFKWDTFDGIKTNGTLYYPTGSDYSSWLTDTSTKNIYYYGWNGVQSNFAAMPERLCITCKYGAKNSNVFYSTVGSFWRDIYDVKVNGESIEHDSITLQNLYVNEDDVVEVYLPSSVIPSQMFWNTNISYVEIQEGITVVGSYFCTNSQYLKEVILPDSLCVIGTKAFSNCSVLPYVNIPDNVSRISNAAFESCSSLKAVTIGSGCKSIGTTSFKYCTSLKNIYIKSESCSVEQTTFVYIARGGTLDYPTGSDYSQWLSTSSYYLGYYGWNGITMEPEDMPTEDPYAPVLDFQVSNINAPGNGVTTTVSVIKQNIEEITITKPDWITITEVSGGYEIVVLPNPTTNDRTGEIIFSASSGDYFIEKVITVYQAGADIYLTVTPDVINLTTQGKTLTINVDSNTPNITTSHPNWISLTKKSETIYQAVIAPENNNKERQGTIYFTASAEGKKSVTVSVKVYQEKYDKPYVILSDNDLTLNDEGNEKEIQVTYVNISEIVAPEIPDGYEVEKVSTNKVSDNTVQVTYRVKKAAANVGAFKTNFTGKDGNGSIIESETLTVEGWPSEKKGAVLDSFRFTSNPENDFHFIYGMEDTIIFRYEPETRYIEFNIDNYTKPFNVSIGVNDDNYCIHSVSNESTYDDEDGYCVWELGFESEGNDSNAPYEGTIDIHYTDANTDITKTIPFYVRYETQGFIKAFSNNYKFDIDGVKTSMYDDIGVGYYNIATINTPTCSPWISLSAPYGESSFYETGKSYRYDITVEPNDGPERTGVMTFSGLGVDGKTWVTEVSVYQEGNDTIQIIDEGFIELQSLSVVLPAEGGSNTFQVKYYDAKVIEMPELVDDWAYIEEVSRTAPVDDVAWNGEQCQSIIITYRVTAQPSTTGREMKVICRSYINYYDGGTIYMEKDKFRIQQLAPGSIEYTGRVVPFRNELTYTNYGGGESLRVGYKDVVVLAPEINVNWVRVKSIADKSTSKEYDYIKEYQFDFDRNESEITRFCNITFRGENEDGTLTTSVVTIYQQGENITEDVGNYSNYRGYFTDLEGKLYSVSIISNPYSTAFGNIILAGDEPVTVSYNESKRLYEPLRTSTCTVRIVSSTYLMDIYTGKAQGTQVILKDEDTNEIKWCGYLQPNLYNQGFSAPIEEIELEASDCLSTLQYFKYEHYFDNGRFTVPFSNIIEDIMDRCGLINSYYVTEKPYSDSYQTKMLTFNKLFIAEQNFFSEEDEPWTLKEVLEEICKYFGYVCYQWGDSVYFMDFDRYSNGKMTGSRFDKSESWFKQHSVNITTAKNTITADSYRGSDGDMSLDDVFNKVTVNCNYYNVEDIIPDLFDDKYLTNRFGDGSMFSIPRYTGRGNTTLSNKTYYKVYDHKYINSIYYLPLNSTMTYQTKVEPTDKEFENRMFFRNYVGGNIIDMLHLGYNEANGKVGEAKQFDRYLLISQLNRPWCGAMGTFSWEDYNLPIMEFKDLPVIFIDNNADENVERTTLTRGGNSGFGSSSSVPHDRTTTSSAKANPVPNYLVIKASAIFVSRLDTEYFEGVVEGISHKFGKDYYNYTDAYTFDHIRNTPALCFYLEIPQAGWWNGSEWVHYKTHFEVPLEYFGDGQDDDEWYEHVFGLSKDVKNTIETNLFLGTTGYKIPLPKEMTTTQEMYFAIALPKRFVHLSDSQGGDYTGKAGNGYCFVKDLSMQIINRNSALYEEEDVIYENIIDEGNVIEGETIDLRITSDRYNGFSYSNVSTLTEDDNVTTDIMFYNKDYILLKPEECIIERYVNQYSTPSIKTNVTLDLSFAPHQLITDTYWEKDFVMLGQEIDYKYGRQTITLLEKK